MSMKVSLTIGKLADASGVNLETVRHYPKEYITRILFIKRSQELGFTLKETKELLDLKIKNQSKCIDVLSKIEEKIQEIHQKINDLKKMKKSLQGLANCCVDTNQPLSDCPILECFIN